MAVIVYEKANFDSEYEEVMRLNRRAASDWSDACAYLAGRISGMPTVCVVVEENLATFPPTPEVRLVVLSDPDPELVEQILEPLRRTDPSNTSKSVGPGVPEGGKGSHPPGPEDHGLS